MQRDISDIVCHSVLLTRVSAHNTPGKGASMLTHAVSNLTQTLVECVNWRVVKFATCSPAN